MPAFAGPTLDLTTEASSGYIDLARFEQIGPQTPGTGVIEPSVGLSTNQDVSPGYTDADNWIPPNDGLDRWSGSGGMLAYLPESFFDQRDGDHVDLYSRFGGHYPNNAGFEEWAVQVGRPPLRIPVTGAVVLAGIGVCFVGWLRRRETF